MPSKRLCSLVFPLPPHVRAEWFSSILLFVLFFLVKGKVGGGRGGGQLLAFRERGHTFFVSGNRGFGSHAFLISFVSDNLNTLNLNSQGICYFSIGKACLIYHCFNCSIYFFLR